MNYKVMWFDDSNERHEAIIEADSRQEAIDIIEEDEEPWEIDGVIEM